MQYFNFSYVWIFKSCLFSPIVLSKENTVINVKAKKSKLEMQRYWMFDWCFPFFWTIKICIGRRWFLVFDWQGYLVFGGKILFVFVRLFFLLFFVFSLFINMKIIFIGSLGSFIFRSSSLFYRLYRFLLGGKFSCWCRKYVGYVLPRIKFICCHTHWWLVLTFWWPSFFGQVQIIISNSWCNVHLF